MDRLTSVGGLLALLRWDSQLMNDGSTWKSYSAADAAATAAAIQLLVLNKASIQARRTTLKPT